VPAFTKDAKLKKRKAMSGSEAMVTKRCRGKFFINFQ
jgi:hypothetical protein